MSEFKANTSCVIDSFGGLVPATAIEILEPGTGQMVTGGKIRVRVNKTMGGYTKGEIVERPAGSVVPKSHIIRREYSTRINTLYSWVC